MFSSKQRTNKGKKKSPQRNEHRTPGSFDDTTREVSHLPVTEKETKPRQKSLKKTSFPAHILRCITQNTQTKSHRHTNERASKRRSEIFKHKTKKKNNKENTFYNVPHESTSRKKRANGDEDL